MTNWNKVENIFHKFDLEENKSVEGTLKTIQTGTYGDEYVLNINEKDVIVGSYGVLKSKIKADMIGKLIKIDFLGEVKSENGRTYKNFEVFTA